MRHQPNTEGAPYEHHPNDILGRLMALPRQADDFPAWYQDVVRGADLAENSLARGTMVIKPYGYAIWEAIRDALDYRFKHTDSPHENVYFPLFIPQREVDVLVGRIRVLKAVVERVADRFPDRVAVRLDHHRAARERVLGKVGPPHDVLVPGGEVVGLPWKGHQAPQDSGREAATCRRRRRRRRSIRGSRSGRGSACPAASPATPRCSRSSPCAS